MTLLIGCTVTLKRDDDSHYVVKSLHYEELKSILLSGNHRWIELLSVFNGGKAFFNTKDIDCLFLTTEQYAREYEVWSKSQEDEKKKWD